MDDGTSGIAMGGTLLVVAGIWTVVALGFYIWYLWSLSRLFPKIGLPSSHGWIPVWNQWQLIQRGGLPGWLVLLGLVPGLGLVVYVVSIIAINRINAEHGKGVGFTVLGALLPPVWAILLANHIADSVYAGPSSGVAYSTPSGIPGFEPQGSYSGSNEAGWQQLPPLPAEAFQPQQQQYAQPGTPAFPYAEQSQHPNQLTHSESSPPHPWVPPTPQPAPPAPMQEPTEMQAPLPQAPPGSVPPAQAGAWGFSNTTEGAFERLAVEDPQSGRSTPFGAAPPQQQYSWPSPEPMVNEGGRVQPSLAQDGPQQNATVPSETAAPPVPPHAPPAHTTEVHGLAAPGVPATTVPKEPAVAKPFAEANTDTDLESPAAAQSAFPASPSKTLSPEEDLDHTVVVVRRTRWGLELPDGEVLELLTDDVVLGRKPEAPEGAAVLQIVDPTRTMSKTHARLRREGESWTIEDLQSTNGVAIIDEQGQASQIDAGSAVPATPRLVIGTLEVKLHPIA